MPSTTPATSVYEIRLAVPTWVVSVGWRLVLGLSIFYGGVLAGGGKLKLPTIHWPSTPATPSRPDWIPPNPPPAPTPTPINEPDPVPVDEWRPLSWAQGWEGYGHDVNGTFMVSTWRLIPPPAQALPAQQTYQGPVIYRGTR